MNVTDFGIIGDFAAEPTPGIEFVRLADPSGAMPQSPRFTFGTFHNALARMYYGLRGLSSVGVFVARDLRVSDVYVLSRDSTIFRCPELNIHPQHIELGLARISGRVGSSVRVVHGRVAMILGPGHSVYGHWLVEFLPKLALLEFSGYRLSELRFLLPSDTPKWGIDWLAAAGIKPAQFVIYDPFRETILAEEILIPTILHNGNRMSPLLLRAAAFLRAAVQANCRKQTDHSYPTRIFASRKLASQSRPLRNRDEIEGIAREFGFDVVHPEHLSLAEQVQLFAGAEQIIGEYGSALHGSLFSDPGTIVCALRGSLPHPGFIQSGLGDILRQPTGYVFGETDITDPAQSFLVDPDDFRACIELAFAKPRLGCVTV